MPENEADAAEEYYAAKRSGTSDPQRAYAVARAQMKQSAMRQRLQSDAVGSDDLKWDFLGPSNVGGRTRTLIIDPSDPNVMYAGGVSGGVWKTTNGGARWDAIGDELVNLAVNSMAMDPRDHNTLYAGTGEGYFREEVRGTGLPLRGNGIFVTRDAGATWQQLASTANDDDFHWVNDLVVSVHDSNRIYAATRSGVWRSTDRGDHWTAVLSTNVTGGCLDLAMRADSDGDYFFASCGTFDQATIYRSEHGENNDAWTAVFTELQMGRTTLAIAPSRPSTIYALSSNNGGSVAQNQAMRAVYRSDANGDPGSWIAQVRQTGADRLTSLLLTNVFGASQTLCGGENDGFTTMGWYCNTIAVDPADPERVFAGGVDLFRSDDGGKTWGLASYWWANAPSFAHADQHNIIFHPQYDGASNQTLFLTNDGGVYRTTNARAAVARDNAAPCDPLKSSVKFVSLSNEYGVAQFYHGAVFPDGKRFLAGAQDNNTLLGDVQNGTIWQPRVGGDGGYVAVDPVDPAYVYAEAQGANLFRSDDGGKTFKTSIREGLNDKFLFVTPFILDPVKTTRLWIGGTRIWRSDERGANWRAASTPLNGQVSAFAVAPGDSNFVVAATSHGFIYISHSAASANATTEWQATVPREGWVSSLAFDPTNASTIYATYAGFGGKHVWRSIDAGASWSALDTDALPDIPIHSIAIEPSRPDRIYLGTDLGVFVSTDRGAHWSVANANLPAVVTEWVTIAQGARGPAIYAFTHGRGAWRAELSPPTRRRSVRQ